MKNFQFLFVFLLLFLLFSLSATAQHTWWNSNWSYKEKIIVNYPSLSSTVSNPNIAVVSENKNTKFSLFPFFLFSPPSACCFFFLFVFCCFHLILFFLNILSIFSLLLYFFFALSLLPRS